MSTRRKSPPGDPRRRSSGLAEEPTGATDAVKLHVQKILEGHRAYNEALAAKVRQIEAAGGRVIDSGQTGSYDDDGNTPWEISDWRTGEVLAKGVGTFQDYDAALQRLDPDNAWWGISNVHDQFELEDYDPTPTDGIPSRLAELLSEWADVPMDQSDAEEIAKFIGWDAARVVACCDEHALLADEDSR